MSWWSRLAGRGWDGRSGRPRSSNQASSHHLVWDAPPGAWVAAEVTLEVTGPPAVASLYFWALQVSFEDRGRRGGGAHLGLQWYPPHPGSTAVNWGGYGPSGAELAGSASTLPSATGNPNTRDLAWRPGTPYRLAVRRAAPEATGLSGAGPGGDEAGDVTEWVGSVTDLATGHGVEVRRLRVEGTQLVAPMVWSEVFADCDAPATEVTWRDLALVDAGGAVHEVRTARTTYQSVADGGCRTADSTTRPGAFVQRHGRDVDRTTPANRTLRC